MPEDPKVTEEVSDNDIVVPEPGEVGDMELGIPGDPEPLPDGDSDEDEDFYDEDFDDDEDED